MLRTPTVLVLTTGLAFAQGSGANAKLTGLVTDSSGGAMPKVVIEVQDLNTGFTRSTVSNDAGYYNLDQLPRGVYRLIAKAAGFSQATYSPIELQIRQVANLDVTMQPGEVVQQVDVVASTLRLESQTSDIGQSLNDTMIHQLPTAHRNPIELVGLVPGVTQVRTRGGVNNDSLNATTTWGRSNYSLGGGFRNTSGFLLDGVDASHSYHAGGSGANVIISPDSVDEFRLHTFNYSAELPRGNGVLNLVTKSGTNDLHGLLSYFHQNSGLNANHFFNNARGAPRPFLIRHQYNYTVGGPIYIPKVYDGRNRTFFFTDYGELRQPNANPFLTRVPTDAERRGDFSNIFATNGDRILIYNPFDTFTNAAGRIERRPFPNSQIPVSLFTPFSQNVLRYYPSPNRPGGELGAGGVPTQIGNYFVSPAANIKLGNFNLKLDHQINAAHRLSGRHTRNPAPTTCRSVYGNISSPENCLTQKPTYTNLIHTWVVSPKLLINQSLYYLTSPFFFDNLSKGFDLASLGGPYSNPALTEFIRTQYPDTSFPSLAVGGYGSLGNSGSGGNHRTWGYMFNLSKFTGNHNLKTGFHGYIRPVLKSYPKTSGGSFSFTSRFTNGPDPLLPSPNTGNGLADLLLGTLGGGSVSSPTVERWVRSHYYGFYFQDDWRVTPKLTLNLGVRYDFELPSLEQYDNIAVFDATVASPIGNSIGPNTDGKTLNQFFGRALMGGYVFALAPEINGRRRPAASDFSNIAPRFGFAYRIAPKWVLRGGFGRVYWPTISGAQDNGQCPSCDASTSVVATVDGINPAVSLTNPFPGGLNLPTRSSLGLLTRIGEGLRTGAAYPVSSYAWQWNLDVQRELPANSLLSVAYAANRGRRLQCPNQTCSDQLSAEVLQQFGSRLLGQVPNPFYGIINNPNSILSNPTVQLGQLHLLWPQYVGGSLHVPGVQNQRGFGHFDEEYPFKSYWDALLVSFEKRLSGGLQVLVAYTFSKSLTNADSFDSGWMAPVAGYQDVYNMRNEKSLSVEDTPHRLVLSHVYELPIGKGKAFGSDLPRAVNAIVGNWQVSGFLTLQSGTPLQINVTPDNSGKRSGLLRPNLVSTPTLTEGSRGVRLDKWFDPNAFVAPVSFTLGNAPRLLNIRGDGTKEYELSLAKFIPITERVRAEFRTDFFNAFNRPQFANPNTTLGSAIFTRVTATAVPPRFIQFGLRVLW